tara:strand:- start:2396 stop:3730 length:1335 start_codon:yes stop_codon:yes gene_type:complete
MNFNNYFYLWRYALGKKGTIEAYKNAITNQVLSNEDLDELSWSKSKNLVHFAFNNVPWYHEKFKTIGLHPNDISKPEYFQQIPILKRHEIIDNFEKFIAKGITLKDLNFITTGGSSGTPLKIGVSKSRIREVQKWQMLDWWNTPLNADMASLYRGLPIKGLKKMALHLINWPQRVIRMDATQITPHEIVTFIQKYKKIQPKIIHGYVGAIDTIADYILENKISFSFKPNAIILTAAPVSAIQEHKISKAFNAPVCDQYGCSEIYFIASECKQKKGLHVFADSVKVEIVDENNKLLNNGEHGKIILTNLEEYAFPLIRYENGDESRLLNEPCTCGLTLPLMDKVKGRTSDNLTFPNGLVLSGEYLTTIFDNYTANVKQFQIIQKKDLSILVRVKLYTNKDATLITKVIENELGKRINNQVSLKLEFVSEIKQEKGKLKFIIKEEI